MALPRFFLEDQVIADEVGSEFALRLNPEDLKHAQVLRIKAGEHIAVIDAKQDYFECRITEATHDLVKARISQKQECVTTRPSVVLVQGIAKGEKMDMVIRHATELGVEGFIPFACERSIVKLDEKKAASRRKRWSAIAKSAAMQSGQTQIPEIGEVMSLVEISTFVSQASAVLVCWEEEHTNGIREKLTRALEQQQILPQDARIVVVVGPEGGLTEHEVSVILGANRHAMTVSLGASILRTETAGIVAPALVLYELGALG